MDSRIVLADSFWSVGEVEFNGPTTTRLDIYDDQPVVRLQQVARVRLAVQQLLGPVMLADSSTQFSQGDAEQLSVRVGQRWSLIAVRQQLSSRFDSIGEVRCGDVELAHAGVQPASASSWAR